MSIVTPSNELQVMVKKVYKIFFTPNKYEVKPSDEEILKSGNNFRLKHEALELAVSAWGDESNPKVLLMHGWGGARAQMTGFVKPLLNAGYFVVAYDQPAHGESDGKQTNILEIAPTLAVLSNHFGKFDFIIAHSLGTLITSYALVNQIIPSPSKLAYFGAFNRLLDSLPRFQALAQLSDETMRGLEDMLFENHSKDLLESITNAKLAQQIHIPALMFHDKSDNVTPVDDSRAIAKAWKNARYVETDGLGHRGALQSKEIHEQVIKFLKS
ncbi:MAG: alpha/beta hydrolase [Anaerolineales bacterium]|nr:alpha/beta hydrolase [Anaerolineales bacterium]MCZ2123385.1 alpha/beta hydrolase [Anaerolineales bacterium]